MSLEPQITIPIFTLVATAWYWLPWLFYLLTFIPMPPMPPDNRVPAGVEKAR